MPSSSEIDVSSRPLAGASGPQKLRAEDAAQHSLQKAKREPRGAEAGRGAEGLTLDRHPGEQSSLPV